METINETANKAIKETLSGWSVSHAIGEKLSEEFAINVVAGAVNRAVQDVNVDDLTRTLVAELNHAVKEAVTELLREAVLETVCKLRGLGDYTPEDREARKCIKASLFPRD